MVRAGLSTGPGASAKMAGHSVWHPSWGRHSLDSVAEWGRAGERLGNAARWRYLDARGPRR
jgi:hypothetical protein